MPRTFQPYTWQTPHTKMLDKWQLGDITKDDLIEWVMWLESLQIKIPSEYTEFIALIFAEEDEGILFQEAENLILAICEKLDLVTPKYDFAYPNYGLEITEPFYQR